MIICKGCGHGNEPDAKFCDSCGGFLEWQGEKVPPPRTYAEPPVAEPVEPAPQTRVSLLDRIKESIGLDDSAKDEAAGTAPLFQQRSWNTDEGPDSGPVLTQLETVPEADELLPQEEYRRHGPRRVAIDGDPDDLYCGKCGRGNADGRFFCRHCGAELADASRTATKRLSWWRRLFRRNKKDDGLTAGSRPDGWSKPGEPRKRRHWGIPTRIPFGKFAPPFALLIIAGLLISPLRGQILQFASGGLGDIMRKIKPPQLVAVTPVSATGGSAKGHPASFAIDNNTSTFWAENSKGAGAGATLVIRFDQPTDLDVIGFHNGAPKELFTTQPRLERVRLSTPQGVLKDITLADKKEFQHFDIKARDVAQVTLTIMSVYPGQKGSAASVSDISFQGRG